MLSEKTYFFVTCYNPEQYNVTRDSSKVWLFVTRSTSSVMSHIITNIFHSIWQVEKAFVCVHAPHWTAALVCGADQHLWLLPLAPVHCTSQHSERPASDTFLHQSVFFQHLSSEWQCGIAQMISIKTLVTNKTAVN